MDTQITVDSRAVQTQVDAKGNRCPSWVLSSTIETYLADMRGDSTRCELLHTLFAGFVFSFSNMRIDSALVAAMIVYQYQRGDREREWLFGGAAPVQRGEIMAENGLVRFWEVHESSDAQMDGIPENGRVDCIRQAQGSMKWVSRGLQNDRVPDSPRSSPLVPIWLVRLSSALPSKFDVTGPFSALRSYFTSYIPSRDLDVSNLT